MEQGALFLLVIAVAVVALYASWWFREQRRKAWRDAAAAHGLAYDLHDPFGLLDMGFSLFDLGEGNGIENVIHGTLGGMTVRAFDFWFWVTSTDSKGVSSRRYSRFCCAVARTPLRGPHVMIEPENLLTRFADVVGFRDQEFESEEFNRAFQVRAADPRFASYLIDARMMEWLLANGNDVDIEVLGDAVLLATSKMSPASIGWLLERVTGFCARIPNAAREVYGADA